MQFNQTIVILVIQFDHYYFYMFIQPFIFLHDNLANIFNGVYCQYRNILDGIISIMIFIDFCNFKLYFFHAGF